MHVKQLYQEFNNLSFFFLISRANSGLPQPFSLNINKLRFTRSSAADISDDIIIIPCEFAQCIQM